MLLGFVSSAHSADFETMDDCLNAYGKTWAKTRQSYCNQPGRVSVDEPVPGRVGIDEAKYLALLEKYADEALAQAKADGMTCAKRYRGDEPVIKCRDEVGEFQLRY